MPVEEDYPVVHPKVDPKTLTVVTVVPVEGESSASSLDLKDAIEPESQSRRKRLFSGPWTRKRIAIWSVGTLLVLGLIATAIAVPVVRILNRPQYIPNYPYVPVNRTDPNYHAKTNTPLFALKDFPDPGLLFHNGTWIAYGTNAKRNDPNTTHVPVATSTDFLTWTKVAGHDAMPNVGKWELKKNHWAPDVIERDDGKFVLYYSGELADWRPHHCIGAAVSESTSPLGPFVPLEEPLACPRHHGGAIDPSPFRDVDGKLYVAYKADGNSVGRGGNCGNSRKPLAPVPIMLQELKSDGVTPVGDAVEILNITPADGPLVEAPNIIRAHDGTYYIFFSSHCYNSPKYNVKYAHSHSLTGPYIRANLPLLQTGDFDLKSPGGATATIVNGTKLVFHANCSTGRCMYAAGMDIRADKTITIISLTDMS